MRKPLHELPLLNLSMHCLQIYLQFAGIIDGLLALAHNVSIAPQQVAQVDPSLEARMPASRLLTNIWLLLGSSSASACISIASMCLAGVRDEVEADMPCYDLRFERELQVCGMVRICLSKCWLPPGTEAFTLWLSVLCMRSKAWGRASPSRAR